MCDNMTGPFDEDSMIDGAGILCGKCARKLGISGEIILQCALCKMPAINPVLIGYEEYCPTCAESALATLKTLWGNSMSDNYEPLRIAVRPQMSREEIIDLLKKNPYNGSYAKRVCRRCGAFWVDPKANADEVLITDSCSRCRTDMSRECTCGNPERCNRCQADFK